MTTETTANDTTTTSSSLDPSTPKSKSRSKSDGAAGNADAAQDCPKRKRSSRRRRPRSDTPQDGEASTEAIIESPARDADVDADARAARDNDNGNTSRANGDGKRAARSSSSSPSPKRSKPSSRGGRGRGRDRDRDEPSPASSRGSRAVDSAESPVRSPEEDYSETPFGKLGLRNSVVRGVIECGFEKPTEIQSSIIPPLLEGRHVIGQARTGTGKTAAFGLPLLHMVDKSTPLQALILVPTRELTMQVQAELNDLAQFTPVHSVAIYGGDPILEQRDRLRRGPQIVVGTPGRVMDMNERGYLPYDNMRFVVLDEVDRMLDIGFREDIRRILKGMPADRHPQTIFVSATLSPEIESLAKKHMVDPVKIEALEGALTVDRVTQSYATVQPWDKPRLLKYLLEHEEPELTLVFCRMKVTVDKLTESLKKDGFDARAIHGDMPQRKRNQIMQRLRSGTLSVIVASDLAARGLDVSGISHVVNYDLPEDPEIYVHRIGRTARAGREGIAWSFVTPGQGHLLTQIEKFANVHIPSTFYPDFKPGPLPKKVQAELEAKDKELERKRGAAGRYSGPKQVWNQEGGEGDVEGDRAANGKGASDAAVPSRDPQKFPGGIVPTKPPKRTLGGRVRTRRRK